MALFFEYPPLYWRLMGWNFRNSRPKRGQNRRRYITLLLSLMAYIPWCFSMTILLKPRKGGWPIPVNVEVSTTFFQLRERIKALKFDPMTITYAKNPQQAFNNDFDLGFYQIEDHDIFLVDELAPDEGSVLAMKERQVRFLSAVMADEEKVAEVERILHEIPVRKREDFLLQTRSEGPEGRTAFHIAAQKGHLETLKKIKEIVGDVQFKRMLDIKDSQNKTTFMLAVQAAKRRKETLMFILENTRRETLSLKDGNKGRLTAFDWAVFQGEKDPEILQLIHSASGSSFAKDEMFSGLKRVLSSDLKRNVRENFTELEEQLRSFSLSLDEIKGQIDQSFK